MSKLIAYKDNDKQCWSRINLSSGEPVWISIAQTGVLIKRSRLGIRGAILFDENEIIACGDIARSLNEQIDQYNLPDQISNAVLKAFTQTALDSGSATELCSKLSKARNAKKY